MKELLTIIPFIIILSIGFAEEIGASVNVVERLPTGYVVLVKSISPFIIGAGVLVSIISLLFGLEFDLRKIINTFIIIAVLVVASIMLVSMI